MRANKFKIGQLVRLRSSGRAGPTAGNEYRVVLLLPQADSVIRYRVRNSADEHNEMVVRENELQGR